MTVTFPSNKSLHITTQNLIPAILLPTAAFLLGWALARPTNATADGAIRTATPSRPPTAAPVPPQPTERKRDPTLLKILSATENNLPLGDSPQDSAKTLARLAQETPELIAPLIARLPEGQRPDTTLAVASYWGTTDPEATLTWIDSLPANDLSWRARQFALTAWGSVDAQAALRHIKGLSPEEQRALADEGLGDGVLAEAIDSYPMGQSTLEMIADYLPPAKKEQALALLEASQDHGVRTRAAWRRADILFDNGDIEAAIQKGGLQRFAKRLAEADPEAALRLASEYRGPGLSHVIGEWARTDPSAALEAAQSIADDPSRGSSSIDAWRTAVTMTDPRAAARSFVDSNIKASDGGVSLNGVLERYLAIDEAAAIGWVKELPDRHLTRTKQYLLRRWRQLGYSDPEAMLAEQGL